VTGLNGNFVKRTAPRRFSRLRQWRGTAGHRVFLSIEEPAQVVLLLECGPAALFFEEE